MQKGLLFIGVFIVFSGFLFGQEKDTVPVRQRKNVIRINPTPALLFSNIQNITFGYERLLKHNQSFMIQLGYLNVAPLFEDSLGGFIDIERVSNFGVNGSFDYRFYPLKRNKFQPPNGLYFGPYLSYYGFTFKDDFGYYQGDTINVYGNYSSTYHFVNLGFMVGYQLIFWKWFSIDMLIFGPSLTYSLSNWKVSTDIDDEDEQELLQEIKEKFNDKYPLLVPFTEPNEGTQSATFRMLFRYSISLGVHF